MYGNVDNEHSLKISDSPQDFKNVKLYGEIGELELDGKKIAMCHYPQVGQGLSATGKYDYVFYGHNHQPWEENVGDTRLINPGTLAGLFSKASFAALDLKTGNLELKILEKM